MAHCRSFLCNLICSLWGCNVGGISCASALGDAGIAAFEPHPCIDRGNYVTNSCWRLRQMGGVVASYTREAGEG